MRRRGRPGSHHQFRLRCQRLAGGPLGVSAGTPLLAITRTSCTADGTPFEFSQDLFRADRTRVTFRTKADRAHIGQRAASDRAIDLRPPAPAG